MDLKPFFEKVEDAIQTIGVDPVMARCEGEGQWLLNRGEIEVYIDIWQPEEHQQWEYFKDEEPSPIFQIVAPVCMLPEDEASYKVFLEEILYMNFHMFYGSFTVNFEQRMAALRFRRLLEGINRVEMIEPIESIGFYAESLQPYLVEKYKAKKIQNFS
ncbi:MAG: hypothetical protein H6606_02080 [Flavobacteriales bacterium]|nr:hypothetical protein [Flavobacteriales bacterium]